MIGGKEEEGEDSADSSAHLVRDFLKRAPRVPG